MLSSFKQLLHILSARRRLQLLILCGLMLISALSEAVSLSAMVPFLAVLVNPEKALSIPIAQKLTALFNIHGTDSLRLFFTVLVGIAVVFSGLVRFVLIYFTARINSSIGHELCAEAYRRSLYQPYSVHMRLNSSETIATIDRVNALTAVTLRILNIISALIIGIGIIITLLIISPAVSTILILTFGVIYAGTSFFTRTRLMDNSKMISKYKARLIQEVQEGVGGIRDILIDHSQKIHINRFKQLDMPIRRARISNQIISLSPRFAVESIVILLIAFLGYGMSMLEGGLTATITTFGTIAVGAQRLMPLLQNVYSNWAGVTGLRQVILDAVEAVTKTIPPETQLEIDPLPFKDKMEVIDLSFAYQDALPRVLHNVSLTVRKGDRVGFLGPTGCGKSTALDLIMGLLEPTEGIITVDGRKLDGLDRLAWQRNIAHVPQSIFLADTTFAENIAIGVPAAERIDLARVCEAARHAHIADFIEDTREGYETTVGERGIRLSGGQRQRIGIARALYKGAKVLIFDEATSALDSATELKVMHSIKNLGRDITVFIVAHRLSTLEYCDTLFMFDKSRIVVTGPPGKFIENGELRRTSFHFG